MGAVGAKELLGRLFVPVSESLLMVKAAILVDLSAKIISNTATISPLYRGTAFV